jgi:hypothetical protein
MLQWKRAAEATPREILYDDEFRVWLLFIQGHRPTTGHQFGRAPILLSAAQIKVITTHLAETMGLEKRLKRLRYDKRGAAIFIFQDEPAVGCA